MALTHVEVKPNVFHITDGIGNFCTLLAGTTGAVLFDTMLGSDDLKGYVAALTPFAPTVIASHFHFDHLGGAYQFERVYLHPAEFPLLPLGRERIPVLTETLHADLSPMAVCYTDLDRLAPIGEGTVLDLGGLTAEVIHLPGHTAGSIGLLCRERGLLLAADALSPQYCIFFRESLPLARSAQTLEEIKKLPFDHFLSAHFDFLFPRSAVDKFRAAMDLPEKKKGMQYQYPLLPEEHGRFFVVNHMDDELGQLIGIVVKEEDVPALRK